MNHSKGIIIGFILLSGSIFAPTNSFAQNNQGNSGFISSLFDLIQQFFPSAQVEISTDSDSIEEFNEATITVTNSTTSNRQDEPNDENMQENDNTPEFVDADVQLSSNTSPGNESKATLCHVPTGNPENAITINVGSSSVADHLSHGDYLGECIDITSNTDTETNVPEFQNATVDVSSDTSVDSKTVLCHVPPGNPSKAHTITIGSSAVDSHLSHGDYLGECSSADDSDSKSKGKENKNKSNGKNKD